MPDASSERRAARRARSDDATLDDVRRVVLGPERERIARLEARQAVSAASIGDRLPEAIAHSNAARPEALAIALEPALTSSVRVVARREPQLFGEILAPTIGAAVRRAVAEAMAAMLQRFDEALERSLSVESIRWRLEARRTGRPFAEVVLLHTLAYRVEQVFLIHTETGILLQHVAREHEASASPDQVASMLSAIDSFSRDAFGPLPPGAHLRRFQVGDLFVWVERDSMLTIAAVVRGAAPESFAEALDETRERLRLAYAAELAAFGHDVSPFVATRAVLERLLATERRPPSRRAAVWLAAAGLVLLVIVGALAAVRLEHRADEARRRARYIEAFEAEPGVLLTALDRVDGTYRLTGLRDPIAARPEVIIESRGLPAAELRFEPFHSLDEPIVERRIHRALAPPPHVTLSLDDGTLHAAGTAPKAWIDRARTIAPVLPGVFRYDDERLRGAPPEELLAAAARLEATSVPFERGSSSIAPEDAGALATAVARVERFLALATQAGLPACVEVDGHADATGSPAANARLSRERASRVAALLAEEVEADRLRGRAPADAGRRSATFRAELSACGAA